MKMERTQCPVKSVEKALDDLICRISAMEKRFQASQNGAPLLLTRPRARHRRITGTNCLWLEEGWDAEFPTPVKTEKDPGPGPAPLRYFLIERPRNRAAEIRTGVL
jgi:hypothetical protein